MDVEKGIRSEDIIERSIARIPMYQALDTIIIDTNAKDVAVIAIGTNAIAVENGPKKVV